MKERTVWHYGGYENAYLIVKDGNLIGFITPYGVYAKNHLPIERTHRWESRSGLSWEETYAIPDEYEVFPLPAIREDASPLHSTMAYFISRAVMLEKQKGKGFYPVWRYHYQNQTGEIVWTEFSVEHIISDFKVVGLAYVNQHIVLLTEIPPIINDGDYIGKTKDDNNILARGVFHIKRRDGALQQLIQATLTLFTPRALIRKTENGIISTSIIRMTGREQRDFYYSPLTDTTTEYFDKAEVLDEARGLIKVQPALAVFWKDVVLLNGETAE